MCYVRRAGAVDLHHILYLGFRELVLGPGRSNLHDGIDHPPRLLEARGGGFEVYLIRDFARAGEERGYVFAYLSSD